MSRGGFEALDPCVHCGFCLPACPTYLATGDESDSPRGRILLMRALERGELPPDDPAVREHLDACLGCRGCEPACPAGVGYGRGLEAARQRLVLANGLPLLARLVLAVFRREVWWRPLLTMARWLRATRLPGLLPGFPMQMLAASEPERTWRTPVAHLDAPARNRDLLEPPLAARATVALFRGCVMDTLFREIHEATRRTLTVNGYRVIEVAGQGCCGALHDHAGDRHAADQMVGINAVAFAGRADFVVVNSAGCGALLKEAGRFHPDDDGHELGGKVRDVTELLALAGPRPGAPIRMEVGYDAPCHLEHAQGVRTAPLTVLDAIPELGVRRLPGSDRCCGSAGIYSLLRPAMARAVLAEKIELIARAVPLPEVIATGNPGCLMQIGAGLRQAGLAIDVLHPVVLLDRSYRAAGLYGEG